MRSRCSASSLKMQTVGKRCFAVDGHVRGGVSPAPWATRRAAMRTEARPHTQGPWTSSPGRDPTLKETGRLWTYPRDHLLGERSRTAAFLPPRAGGQGKRLA